MAGSEVFLSSKGTREVQQALTLPGFFGVPRYTTALLPPVTNNQGALAFDTTTSEFKGCDGSAWNALGGGAATEVTPGTTTVTGATNAVLYADASSILRASSSELGFNDSTNQLLLQNGTQAAPSLSFGSDTDLGIFRVSANNLGISSGNFLTAFFGTVISLTPNSTTGGDVSITAAANSVGAGGPLTLLSGNGTTAGGAVLLEAGDGTAGVGGSLTTKAGDGSTTGGNLLLISGDGGSGAAGNVILQPSAVGSASGVTEQRNGTTAQTFRLYGTFTDASNYERLRISHDGSGDAFIAAETAGTGADNQNLTLLTAGTGDLIFTTGTRSIIFDEAGGAGGAHSLGTIDSALVFNVSTSTTVAAAHPAGFNTTLTGYFGFANIGVAGADTFITRESAAVIQLGLDASTAVAQELKGPDSTGSGVAGAAFTLSGGDATSGNANGGNLNLAGGAEAGTGVVGNVAVTQGDFYVQAGGAGDPSITTAADTNTGIAMTGGDVIRLIAGGTDIVQITSASAAVTNGKIFTVQNAGGSINYFYVDPALGGIARTNYERTITAGGTTGNQTINKLSGTVNIAAAGTTVTVTNSLVDANSIVHAVLRTNDATARIANVVPAAGSFVINLTAAATAEVSIGFLVTN